MIVRVSGRTARDGGEVGSRGDFREKVGWVGVCCDGGV